jgi:23S rRNA U2552 (ribose-2'-O)-methylase RlmE/FtsJ
MTSSIYNSYTNKQSFMSHPYYFGYFHEKYKIKPFFQNNQALRLRFFKHKYLNYVIKNNVTTIDPHIIKSWCLYSAYFPESFYSCFELFNKIGFETDVDNCLYIGSETMLGGLEALLFITDNISCDTILFDHDPNVNNLLYVDQFYKFNIVKSIGKAYDCYIIDCCIVKSDTYDNFRQTLYFFVLAILNCVRNNILSQNFIIVRWFDEAYDRYNIIMYLAEKFFDNCYFYQSPFTTNGEVFLVVNKFKNNVSEYTYLKFFRVAAKYDLDFMLDAFPDDTVKLQHKFQQLDKKTIQHSYANNIMEDWCTHNNVLRICDLTPSRMRLIAEIMIFTSDKSRECNCNEFHQKLFTLSRKLDRTKKYINCLPTELFQKSNKNKLLTWEKLTMQLSPFNNIKYIIEEDYGIKKITNAWLKMQEILFYFGKNIIKNNQFSRDSKSTSTDTDIDTDIATINTFHLCEAPGAFIYSLLYYCKNRGINVNWRAQTLNPLYDTNAISDFYGYIKNNNDKWIFGSDADQSGDITKMSIVKYYIDTITDIDFITADGGIQCPINDINNQERYMEKIFLGEFLCVFGCLKLGGSALIKMFLPLKEKQTIALIKIAHKSFETIYFVKPLTSNPSNSEIYLVLVNYKIKSTSSDIINYINNYIKNGGTDYNFNHTYLEIIEKNVGNQIRSIERNLYYYYDINEIDETITDNNMILNQWLDNFQSDY